MHPDVIAKSGLCTNGTRVQTHRRETAQELGASTPALFESRWAMRAAKTVQNLIEKEGTEYHAWVFKLEG